ASTDVTSTPLDGSCTLGASSKPRRSTGATTMRTSTAADCCPAATAGSASTATPRTAPARSLLITSVALRVRRLPDWEATSASAKDMPFRRACRGCCGTMIIRIGTAPAEPEGDYVVNGRLDGLPAGQRALMAHGQWTFASKLCCRARVAG